MAPVATSPTKTTIPEAIKTKTIGHDINDVISGEIDFDKLTITAEEAKARDDDYEFGFLRPAFPNIQLPPIPLKEEQDKALLADPNNNYANLLRDATSVIHVNPKIGTEITGVDLTTLDDTQKNELALLISRRLVVVFRDQEKLDVYKQIELGKYFGELHVNANTPLPIGYEQHPDLKAIHVVYGDEKRRPFADSSTFWHSDVTYEVQPAGYTSLKSLSAPSTGGDTLWSSGYAIYDALSPSLQKYLEGLKATHTSLEQGQHIEKLGFSIRRPPITTEHPIVRTHPVTGFKSIFVDKGFTRNIVGIPRSESDAILNYLYTLSANLQEAQYRLKWNANDTAFWDNRTTLHSAVFDYYPQLRHGIRVTTQAEVPYFDPNSKSQTDVIEAAIAAKRGDKHVPRKF
ncbi:hypothetical protein D0Z03_001167 [Geotrichum reessii]|nr:hypothetical protein D0Z03_001167 [Galactomyces reessii]